MDKNIEKNVKEFQNDILTAGEKLNEFSQSINLKDKNIENIVDRLNAYINNITIEEKNNEFTVQLNNNLNEYKDMGSSWNSMVKRYISGKEFINQFEKSVLFVAFGNVNVGKSSIGNFISGVTPGINKYYDNKPEFFIYDFADNIAKNKPEKLLIQSFKENITEETTTIQYYTLNKGLTWVDSPGIHSINGENEELAKKYVDYADLVLFVMSSSSPAKYDEIMEITRLMNKQKPLLIVINKSDKLEYDEVDGELIEIRVPKSLEDRRKQEEYVKEVFSDNKNLVYTENVDSISISTYLATDGINNNDDELFEQSGIPKFYQKLGFMLKENALELKLKGPKQRINSLIDEILNGFSSNDIEVKGLNFMRESFKQILNKIDDTIITINKLDKELLKEVRGKSIPQIDLEISKMSAKLQSNGDSVDLDKIIEDIILSNFNDIIQKKVSKLLTDFKHDKISTLNMAIDAKLEAKYENYSYKEYTVKNVKRDPKGLLENIGAIFGKEYTELKTKSKEVTRKVLVGDNSNMLVEDIILNLEKNLQPIVSETINNIAVSYFENEKKIIIDILSILEKTSNDLLNEKL